MVGSADRARAVPVVALETRLRRIDGVLVVAPPERSGPEGGEPRSLTDSAELIWREIDGTRTVDEISARVGAHYGIAVEDVADDVAEFLQELADDGLIGWAGPD